MEKMANTNIDILDLQGLGTYDTKIKTEIGKKADDFVPIEYSEWLELTDAQKNEHNWKLLHVPDSGPEPPDVPDGKTVTPTDDVATWLECAGIDPTGFSTLSDVLADSVTLQALMEDNNAVDYLVRSTTWAGIGLVPTMTSATTPSGEVIASTYYSDSYKPYYAFDGATNTGWTPNGSDSLNNAYIGYHFTTPQVVTKLTINEGSTLRTTAVKVCGSNDGSTWTDIASITRTQSDETYTFVNSTAYSYYKVVVTNATALTNVSMATVQFSGENLCDNQSAMSYIGLNNYASNTLLANVTWSAAICNSSYFESVLNVKNPTMTSNNTPSGEASASSTNTTFYPYKAFDYDNSTSWATYTTGAIGDWLRYNFVAKFVPKKIVVKISGFGSGGTYSVEGLNENNQWDALFTRNTTSAVDNYTAILDNVTKYKDFRWYCSNITSPQYSTNVIEMQIYGRTDV